MAQETNVWNAREVTISILGLLIDGGYGDGEFLRLEQESDDTSDAVGTDGSVAVSVSNDGRATFTLTLLQTSRHNDELSGLRNAGRGSRLGVAVGPVYVRDRLGRSVWEAAACWMQRPPDVSLDRAAGSREWTFRVANLSRFDGGNVSIGESA